MAYVLRTRFISNKGSKPGPAGVADEHGGGGSGAISRSNSVNSLSALQGSREGSVTSRGRMRRASGLACSVDTATTVNASTSDEGKEPLLDALVGHATSVHLGSALSWEATLQALPHPTVVRASASIQECAEAFTSNPSLNCILVGDGLGRTAGLLTRKDVARIRAARVGSRSGHTAGTATPPGANDAVLEVAAGTWWASDPIMLWAATPAVTIPRALASPAAAAALMLGHGVTCLPVTDEASKPIGVLTREVVAAQLLAAETASMVQGTNDSTQDAPGMLARLMQGAGRREALMRFRELEELSTALPPHSPNTIRAATMPTTPSAACKPPVHNASNHTLHRLHHQHSHGSHNQSRLSKNGHESSSASYDDLSLAKVAAGNNADDKLQRHKAADQKAKAEGSKVEHKDIDKEKVKALVMDSAWDLLDGVAGVLAVSAAATMVDPASVAVAASSAASAAANAAQASGISGGLFDLGKIFHLADQGRDTTRMLSDVLKNVSSIGVISGVPSAIRALVDQDCPICKTLQVVLDRLDGSQHTIMWDSIRDPDAVQMYAEAADGVSSQGAAATVAAAAAASTSLPFAPSDLEPLVGGDKPLPSKPALPGGLLNGKVDKAAALEVLHTVSAGQSIAKGLPAVLRILAAIDPQWVEVLNVLPLVLPLAGPSFDYLQVHSREMNAKWVEYLRSTKMDQIILGSALDFSSGSSGSGSGQPVRIMANACGHAGH